jgi:hypothetical protein
MRPLTTELSPSNGMLQPVETATERIQARPQYPAFNIPDLDTNNNPVLSGAKAPANQSIAEYSPYGDDGEEYVESVDLEDLGNGIFDEQRLPKSNPLFFKKKTKPASIVPIDEDGIVDGKHFGLPGTHFEKIDNYTGQVGITYYDELFPDEVEEMRRSNFLGFGKKAKAKREERQERRKNKKDDRRARKQARVDRKNKRVDIRQYKAETKLIGKENGEESGLDKVINGAKSIFADQNQINDVIGSDGNGSDGSGSGGYTEDTSGGYGGNIPNPKSDKSKLGMFGGTTGIIILLALVGAAIYMFKNK